MNSPQKRILIFDDQYASMEPLKSFLESVKGYVVELTAAKEITEQLKTECFDLILIDQMIHPVSLDADDNEVHNLQFDGINWDQTGI